MVITTQGKQIIPGILSKKYKTKPNENNECYLQDKFNVVIALSLITLSAQNIVGV